MKKLINIKHAICLFLTVSAVAILQSCVVYRPNTAQLVSVPDIIQMSKDGVSSKDIISEIKQSHTAYDLKADQLIKLHNEGFAYKFLIAYKSEDQSSAYVGSVLVWCNDKPP